jgi:hypothetical protein
MAFAAASISALPSHLSFGPKKVEIQSISAVSGDTSGTITASALSRVDAVVVCGGGFKLSAQPTISGTSVTLAYADPVANIAGAVILIGV